MSTHDQDPTERSEEQELRNCQSVRQILSRFGDKWTSSVVGVLGDKRLRFRDIHRAIGTISQRMLAVTLRGLERDGLVVRTAYPTVPPRVEYHLSERGRALIGVLRPFGEWVSANHDAIEESRKIFDGDTEEHE
ncbi:winged helix-turn-helix transcriptional regulator [Pendulispora albinea]|uniref:Helix-turn-helix transcriptional regulator n=1 Tax=Pendulispora albinea TaxID=2741071 RepID=A0ABZ2M2C2_9BACT